MRSVPIAAIGVPMVGEAKAVANHVCLLRVIASDVDLLGDRDGPVRW